MSHSVDPSTEHPNSNQVLDPASTCWQDTFVQVSGLSNLSRNALEFWDQMTLAARMWWHQMSVALRCLLALQKLSAAMQKRLWHGRLEVWEFSCNSDNFSEQVSSLAGGKCWDTGHCSTGISRKEISWSAFLSRDIYHVTTIWALTSST